jgi:bis(5'-nucleosidyl)-tetraphosphatase
VNGIRQAGAVVARKSDGKAQILVVRAKQNPEHWIFPKGHIEQGESPPAAALRELAEEAGVSGTVIAPVGVLQFPSKEGPIRAEYFLVKYQGDVPRQDDREKRWCSYAAALDLLTFPDAKQLLRQARPLIEQSIGSVDENH